MAKKAEDLLWKLAESDEVQIETRRDPKSPLHRTTIWIVPTTYGVYVRSYKGRKGRWYQEALANPVITIRVGRRKVTARAELEHNPLVIRAVNVAYRKKYGERWPDETKEMLRRSVLPTTLRLTPVRPTLEPEEEDGGRRHEAGASLQYEHRQRSSWRSW